MRQHGFTLIELIVALTIAAMLLGALPFAIVRAYDSMEYRATIGGVLTELKTARLQAESVGRPVAFNVNVEERKYGSDGRALREIPQKLQVRILVADIESKGRQGGIRFYPDGSSTGGEIELKRPSGDGVIISVDWLLGRFSQRRLEGG